MADPTSTDHVTITLAGVEHEIDRVRAHRDRLKTRHSQALARLMEQRADLRGVHALADLVHDGLRWSA